MHATLASDHVSIFSGCVNMTTLVASILVMIWAIRIAGKDQVCAVRLIQPTAIGFLLLRVVKRGSDSRFDEIRSHFLKFLGLLLA